MHKFSNATLIWVILLLATGSSLAIAEFGPISSVLSPRLASAAILLVAFFKTRLVILHFMEVATAPIALRAVFEGWLLLTCCALLYQVCYS